MERDYSKHSDKQLAALYVSEDVAESKKVNIEKQLHGRGLVDEIDFKFQSKGQANETGEGPEIKDEDKTTGDQKEEPTNIPEANESPAKPEVEAPEAERGIAEPGKIGDVVKLPGGPIDVKEVLVWEVGDELTITLPKKHQTKDVKTVFGKVIKHQTKNGVTKYKVKTEFGDFVKTEKQLLKDNKI